ncbi:MAG TPA: DUF4118 domain-containing protein [Blastocatellia bacterium]|nr:DUF4118 domain-containing protein [Blastocatellia bacterium]
MDRPTRLSLRAYALAICSTLLALLFTLIVKRYSGNGLSAFFLAAVMVSARFGGLRAALVATVAGSFALDYFFIDPVYALVPARLDSVIWLATFVGVSVLISSLAESLKRAQEGLRCANRDLELRVEERSRELSQANDLLRLEIGQKEELAEQRRKIIADLQGALSQLRALRDVVTVCAVCKSVRDRQGNWRPIDNYPCEERDVSVNQVFCPQCARRAFPDYPFLPSRN